MKNTDKTYREGLWTYGIGFLLSFLLTCTAFLVVSGVSGGSIDLTRGEVIALLAGLASVQLVLQVIFFLHMSTERRARWSLLSGLFAVMVVLIIVIGSIWVMNNLNYNMMPKDTTKYMQDKEAIHHSEHEGH